MTSGAAIESMIPTIEEKAIADTTGVALTSAGLGVSSVEVAGTITIILKDTGMMTTAHGNVESITTTIIPLTGVTAAVENTIAITIVTTAHGTAIAITTTTSPLTGVTVTVGETTIITIATRPAVAAIMIAASGAAVIGGGSLLNGNLY